MEGDKFETEGLFFRSPRKQSVIQVQYLFGGNAKKVIHGRRSSEAAQLHLQSALNAVMPSLIKAENLKQKSLRDD